MNFSVSGCPPRGRAPMAKVRLLLDYTTDTGQEFKAGQTGRVIFLGENPTIAFDGYEKERAAYVDGLAPWIARIPVILLERVNG